MSDRLRGPVDVTATRVGRSELGPSTAFVEDDALVVRLPAAGDDRSLRVSLATIDAARFDADTLALEIHDGTRVVLASDAAADLTREILARCHALPELTRTLRAFGSRRGRRGLRATEASEQLEFFAPLMAARKAAMQATDPAAAIEAFDSSSLAAMLSKTLRQFALQRYRDDAPARRALEAELVDLAEPFQVSLTALREAARAATRAPDDLRLWRAWSARLRASFEAADRVWLALDAVLDAGDPDRAQRR